MSASNDKAKATDCAEKSGLTKIVKFGGYGDNGASPSWREELAFTGHGTAGIGSGSRLAFREGPSSRSQTSDDDGVARWSVGESRGWSEWNDVVERRSPECDVEGEAERKWKGLARGRTERTKPQDAPKAKRKKQQGPRRGGLGREGHWGGARCKGGKTGRRVSNEGSNGKIAPPRALDAERLAGSGEGERDGWGIR